MNNDLILSIDLGTTFIKGFLVRKDLTTAGSHRKRIQTYSRQDGWAEQNPLEILKAVQSILAKLNPSGKSPVVFTNAMHSLVLLDQNFSPISECMIWSDNRSEKETVDFSKQYDSENFYFKSGVPLHPILPLTKLIWYQKNSDSDYKKSRFVSTLKDWIVYSLSNTFITDPSTAASTGLFDLTRMNWHLNLLEDIGIKEDMLPEIKSSDYLLETKYGNIILGATDGPMANYFVNSQQQFKNDMVVTIGTSAAVRKSESKAGLHQSNSGIFRYPVFEDFWVTGLASNNGGNVMEWVNERWNLNSDLSKLKLYPRPNAPLFSPYIFKERAPMWLNPKLSGGLFEMNNEHTADDIMYSVHEGILFNIKRMVDALVKPQSNHKVVVSGGFFRSEGQMQLLADLLNKEVVKLRSLELTALGAALVGITIIDGKMPVFRSDFQSFHPEKDKHEILEVRNKRFLEYIS